MYTAKPQEDVLDAALKTILQIHTQKPPGDILVFLAGRLTNKLYKTFQGLTKTNLCSPGQEDIESLAAMLRSYEKSMPTSSDEVSR